LLLRRRAGLIVGRPGCLMPSLSGIAILKAWIHSYKLENILTTFQDRNSGFKRKMGDAQYFIKNK
jgi:hypothetical protein